MLEDDGEAEAAVVVVLGPVLDAVDALLVVNVVVAMLLEPDVDAVDVVVDVDEEVVVALPSQVNIVDGGLCQSWHATKTGLIPSSMIPPNAR